MHDGGLAEPVSTECMWPYEGSEVKANMANY